ncbi:MAG TPA: hypothetical protein VFY17_10455 [Pilimelia sp.]|nr:hypothetical protein [Pilimelia sp.]
MRAHRTDLLSLFFGLLFVGLALAWTAHHEAGVDLPSPAWLVVGALLAVGLMGLAGALRGSRTDPDATDAPPATAQEEPGRPAPVPDTAVPDPAASDDTAEVRMPAGAGAAGGTPRADTAATGDTGGRDDPEGAGAATPPR